MGNRAVITKLGNTKELGQNGIGLYLHWNGGPESVLAFLEAARRYKIRGPQSDDSYCYARLAQIVGNFFGDTLSVGVNCCRNLDCDNGDNGVYEIDDEFRVVMRHHTRSTIMSVADLSEEKKQHYEQILAEILKFNDPIFLRGL